VTPASVVFNSHSDCGFHDTGWGHPEHQGRLRNIPSALRNHPELFMALDHREGRHATAQELDIAHDPAYVRSIQALCASGGGCLDADTVVSAQSWDAASAGVGCVLDGVDLVLSGTAVRSFSAIRPPGHHALYAAAMGFCLFGNVALGAHYARQRHGLQRILVVDWDVHHGNGTQMLVEQEPDIRFVSMHQWPWYPGTGAADDRGPHGSIWNVPMPGGRPRAEYREALLRAVDAATAGWVPELVMISAGFDLLRGDPLGAFTLELEDVELLTRALVERAEGWCAGRIVSALEGGYSPDLVAAACVHHLRGLL